MFDRSGHLIAGRRRFIDDLASMMTLEELLGQLVMRDASQLSIDGSLSAETLAQLERGEIGTLWLGRDAPQSTRALLMEAQDRIVAYSRLGTPLMVACEIGNGHVTGLPNALTAASSWDPETIARADRIAAIEATADGANWAFGPNIVASDGGAAFADEPTLAARIIGARVRGIQGDRLIRPDTMIATLECHAEGRVEERGAARLNAFLPPYLAAARDGRVGCVALSADAKLIDPLAPNWDFGAIVLSQWEDIVRSATGPDFERSGIFDFPVAAVAAAVRDGRTPLVAIENAARRVLGAKFDLGLFRDPHLYMKRDPSKPCVTPAVHREVALDVARKSVTLLKNANRVLPLNSDYGAILVLGPAAEDRAAPLGENRRARPATSLCDGLLSQGLIHRYLRGTGQDAPDPDIISRGDQMGIALACDAASRAHTVVIAIGAAADDNAEGQRERRLVQAVAKSNDRIVLVVSAEAPPDLSWAMPLVSGIVYAGQLGQAHGEAVAQILCGRYNPAGKLPVATPIDPSRGSNARPLFALGHGLSYTEFAYRDFSVEIGEDRVLAKCMLENVGDLAGEEVAQLYVRNRAAFGSEAAARLRCFSKIRLSPGEARELRFELAASEFGYYTEHGRLALAPGAYQLDIGGSSARTITKGIDLPQAVADAMLQLAGPRGALRNGGDRAVGVREPRKAG